jgi:hypothetical protein
MEGKPIMLKDIFGLIICVGVLLLPGSFAWASVDSSLESRQSSEKQWVLQLGIFANLQNALNYKDQLIEVGFEAETITTTEPGEQRYRVIAGFANDPEEFDQLRDALESKVGERGYVVQNPHLGETQVAEASEEAFDQPRARYLLAQAGTAQPMGGESVGSAAERGYDTSMFRTPQEEIDSIPGFTAAGLQIIPTLGLSIGYDDNITRSNILEQSSFLYIISPAIRVELPSDHSILALTAGIDIWRYTDSKVDDREPWYVRGDWAWDISTRQDLNLFAQYSEGSDQRGTGSRQGDIGLIPFPLDDWKRVDYGGMWRYGAIGARGKLDLRAGGSNLDYTNNRDRTYLFDRDWYYYGGTFYWRVAPKTSLLADLLYTDINYDDADSSSKETSWMLGVTWEASARTSGTIRYGEQKKKFDNLETRDYNGPTWMASVSWRPRTYSVFTLTTTRNTQEPDGNAQYVVRQDISLAWTHEWATRFGTTVDIGYGEDDYRPDVRTDDIWYYGVSAHYLINPHFRLGAGWQGYNRSSDEREFEYTRNIYMLTLEVSL